METASAAARSKRLFFSAEQYKFVVCLYQLAALSLGEPARTQNCTEMLTRRHVWKPGLQRLAAKQERRPVRVVWPARTRPLSSVAFSSIAIFYDCARCARIWHPRSPLELHHQGRRPIRFCPAPPAELRKSSAVSWSIASIMHATNSLACRLFAPWQNAVINGLGSTLRTRQRKAAAYGPASEIALGGVPPPRSDPYIPSAFPRPARPRIASLGRLRSASP